MRYLLTGGGTGGHVYPALAIAEHVRALDEEAQFLYVGVPGKAEEWLVPPTGIPLRTIPAAPLPSLGAPVQLLRFSVVSAVGLARALWLVARWKPHLVVATGGYASAPTVAAAAALTRMGFLRIPIVIHEQNATLGRLNRLAASWATVVACAHPAAVAQVPPRRAVVTGYPVRRSVVCPPAKAEARRALGLSQEARVVVAFGGSTGARTINRALVKALPLLQGVPGLVVIHGTGRPGRGSYDPVAETQALLGAQGGAPPWYLATPYLDPVATYLAAADLVVCRSGAGTINELCAVGRASVLIPKANLPGDHQVMNALTLQAAGAATIVYEHPVETAAGIEEEVDPEHLAGTIASLLASPSRLEEMGRRALSLASPSAAGVLASLVVDLAHGRSPTLPPPNEKPFAPTPVELLALKGPSDLLAVVESRVSSGPAFSPEERAYLAYRADALLASPRWEHRNVGVKLAGALGLQERADLLASLVTLKKGRARAWHRWLGLDYAHNGFIRRNALVALARLRVWNEAVRQAIRAGLHDPYFEVRTAALAAVAAMAPHASCDDEIRGGVVCLTADPRFEVRAAALAALAEVGAGAAVLDVIERRCVDGNWRVRASAVRAMVRLLQRHAVPPDAVGRVKTLARLLLPTSTGFVPHFELKESLAQLSQTLRTMTDEHDTV